MLSCLNLKSLKSEQIDLSDATQKNKLKKALWIDLFAPTKEEQAFVEDSLQIKIPSQSEMREIELSSRLYRKKNNYFMTTLMVDKTDPNDPVLDSVTFILTEDRLLTVHYIHPQSFEWIYTHLGKLEGVSLNAVDIFLDLLESMFDELTDTLESISHRLETYSKSIFRPAKKAKKPDYLGLMKVIGGLGDLNSKVSESLVTLTRLVVFYSKAMDDQIAEERQKRLLSLKTDLNSLSDHINFFSNKIIFLLDATLGFVNIDQNHIIKLVSVAAVVFMPPTLVMSFYGMNFHFIPELEWKYGYLYAVALGLLSSWLPYKYFKFRKWI